MNVLVGHAAQVGISLWCPAAHSHAPAEVMPAAELELVGQSTAAVVSSADPVCVPRQNEPAGHGTQVTDALE